jgi:hypothetical protein
MKELTRGQIPTIGLTVTTCLATEHFSFNRHIWDVRPALYIPERKLTFALYCLYIISGGMIKISILLFCTHLPPISSLHVKHMLTSFQTAA